MADTSARLLSPDASMAGPSQSTRTGGSTRPASAQVYPSSTPHSAQPRDGGTQSARKRASHTVTSSQPPQEEQQIGYRDVYSHPAAVAYAAAHPRRTIPKFGPYLLLQTLGEGEFGKVKLGLHSQWGEEVAVKLIRRGNIDTAVRMSKVEREIEVLRTIKHPNIVRLYDVIETDKYIGIILEYASGGELFDHILAHRYLKEKDACKLFSQLISGVCYIHQKKIVHRDLKLENLLLDRHRNVIITDFGFANRFEHRADDLMQTSCGSPCYAAPELVISEGLYVGSAVDIWSCGVILYAMLAGYLPFDDDPANPDGDNINLLYRYIVNTPLTFPDYVSADARELLALMLVPDPAHRADLPTIMAHRWLRPYAHLFERSVADLERLAMEQHQMKRLAYQRQMKQQAAAAAAEQSKLQRSQSARPEVPQIQGSAGRSRGQPPPPSAMNPEFLYETNPDESLFSSPPPVPITQSSGRRHVASAIVGPSTPHAFEDDPFGPPPARVGQMVQHMAPPAGDEMDMQPEPRSHRSRESTGRTPRKQPPPVAIAPVKMSPERRKVDRQRHTIQLEYGGEPAEEVQPLQPPSRAKEPAFEQQVQREPEEEIEDGSMVIVSDVISPGDFPPSPLRQEASVKMERNGSISNATKPLPQPPSAPTNGIATPKRASSIPTVRPSQPDPTVLLPMENLAPHAPMVSVTPTSPPRAEKMSTPPPFGRSGSDRSTNGVGRNGDGSMHSGGSGSSKKHGRGMSVDKIFGRLRGSGSDTEGPPGAYTNGMKARRPSDASTTPASSSRAPSESLSVKRPETLQVSPGASPDSKASINSANTGKGDEGKKSRRNTLTVMVEPLSKRLSQRANRRAATGDTAAPNGRTKEKDSMDPPVVPVKITNEKDVEEPPVTPRFPPTNRSGAATPASAIPASTSKASKVMQWFRYRSKSRPPSENEHPSDAIGDDYEDVSHPDRDRAATPTAENQRGLVEVASNDTIGRATPQVIVSPVSPPPGFVPPPQAPSMSTDRAAPSIASEASVPTTPHIPFVPRAMGLLSNIVASPSAHPTRGGATQATAGYNKNAIRLHHGAVDQTTVTTGEPPEVMAHVTRVLLDMGLEVQQESEYKYRCIRMKRKKAGASTSSGGLSAFTMVGSAASNGVDKRGLPMPSQSTFSSTGGMLKGLLMRRQSSQVSTGSVSVTHPSFDSEGTDARDTSSSSLSPSREKLSAMPAPPANEPIYGERSVDQYDEVRFSVELTRIDGLDDTFSLDIRRLKGNLRSYKFLYDTLRTRCDFN